ncbi:hypothetical protein PHYC_00361 [Phycisphaerales bacterium]|nr:hypothetical protein PHYC_00361 [Phycisphaerales bacterium]
MKMKGIGTFEQNADKVVLGGVVLVGVGALALQLIAGGSTIKVGTKEVPPGAAFQPVEEEAQRLLARVQSDSPSFPEAPKFTLAGKLALGKDLSRPAWPRVAMGSAPNIGKGDIGAVIATAEYAFPEVPAPSTPVAVAYSATIHPAEGLQNPQLASLLPAQQPFDKAAVSIEFTYSGTELQAALANDPEGPVEPLPRPWWRGQADQGADPVTLIAVEVERELVSGAEGVTPTGSATTILPPLPGRVDSLKVWNDSVKSVGDVPVIVDGIRGVFDEIARPEYYATIAGPTWEQPSKVAERGDSSDKATQVRNTRRKFSEVQRRFDDLTELLSKTPKPDTARRPEPREQPPSRTGGGGKGGSGGPAGGAPSPRTGETRTGNYREIERSLKRTKAELDALAQKLIALGETVEGYEVPAAATDESGLDAAYRPFLDNPSVTMWTHDLTGVPGATYRYRARVVINNPLFDRNLQEGLQKELGKDSLLRGDWSEWSAPVTVDPSNAFFVTSAEDRSEISPRPHATAQIFQFYYGYYRVAQVSLEPGDVVMNDAKLPELRIADMAKLDDMIKKGQMPGAPSAPQAPAAPSRGPGGPGGKSPMGPAPAVRDPGVAPGAAPTPGEKPKIQWPDWMAVELPKTLPLTVDAMLLDVASVPAGDRSKSEAVLRLGNGDIFVKMPEADRQNPLLKKLESSAKEGETQGQDLSIPEPTRSPVFPRRDRQGDRPPGKTGGGGGGGG